MGEGYINLQELITTVGLGLLVGFILSKFFYKEVSKSNNKMNAWEFIVILLSVYVLVEIVISFAFADKISDIAKESLIFIDNFICGIFIFDFFNGLHKSKNKLTYAEIHWIDLIGSIPYYGPLRCCRIFRIMRVLRILRALRSLRYILTLLFKYKKGIDILNYTLFSTIIIVIASSVSIWYLEYDYPGTTIKSPIDAFWWSVYTVFGIGIENVMPKSSEALAFGFILTFSGLVLVAAFTATIVDYLIKDEKIKEQLDIKLEMMKEMQNQLKIKEDKLSQMEINMFARDEKLLSLESKIDKLLESVEGKEKTDN